MNANVLRRWVVEAERADAGLPITPAMESVKEAKAFVPVSLPSRAADETAVRIEVRRGSLTVSVQWPRSALHECAVWLREVIK